MPIGSHLDVATDSATSFNIFCSVEGWQNSRTGSASCPLRIIRPDALVEKSPETADARMKALDHLDQHALLDVGHELGLVARARHE